jgi:hypothetical protein
MSENMQSTRAPKHTAKATQEAPATHTAPANETAAQPNGTASPVVLETFKIANTDVALPNPYREGYVINANEALVLFHAKVRQFTNNQNANYKARNDRLEAAKTDAEREANKHLTAAALADLFKDYIPNVGGTPRANSLDTLRHDMAKRFWSGLVAEHQKVLEAFRASGETDTTSVSWPIAKAAGKPVILATAPRKAKGADEAKHKADVEAFETGQMAFRNALLGHAVYGPQIAVMVEAELAARKAEKPAAPASGTVEVSSVDLL